MAKKKPVNQKPGSGVTRRGFLGSVGAGAAAVATGVTSRSEAVPEITDPEEMVQTALKINGRLHRLLVEPRWTLLFVLRERLGITGTKAACERGECGSCTVLIGDRPRYACLTLALPKSPPSKGFWMVRNSVRSSSHLLNTTPSSAAIAPLVRLSPQRASSGPIRRPPRMRSSME